MAGILKCDQVQSDSNLSFNIAGSNVAFMNATSLQMAGSNISLGGTNVFTSGKLVTSAQPVGAVLQVVSTTKTDSFSSASASYVDITGLSVSITPTSSTSKILVLATVMVGNAGGNAALNLVRNSTNIAQSTSGTANETAAVDYQASYKAITYPILYLDSPATTSATTYKIQLGGESPTRYINIRANDNYYGSISSITVMEIAA